MTLAQAMQSWVENPQFLIGAAIIVLLVLILAGSARQKRELSSAGDKVCGGCGSSHPSFAQFCRKCGKKL
jgi:ribosomal protein L40E